MSNADENRAKAVAADLQNLYGIDVMRKMMTHGEYSPMGELLGMKITEVQDGKVTLQAMPHLKFYNPLMRIHGGYTATLIDTAMGSAVFTKMSAGQGAGTINLNVSYVGKIDIETGLLTVTGQILHAGRTLLTAEAHVTDAKGKLLAHGTGTFLVYPKVG